MGFEHTPVTGLQTPISWHGSSGAHTTGLAPTHAPAWQVSVLLHALLSLHTEPSGFAGFEHIPVATSHTPTAWQLSEAWHVITAPAEQTPA
jgi:hypothetical protein